MQVARKCPWETRLCSICVSGIVRASPTASWHVKVLGGLSPTRALLSHCISCCDKISDSGRQSLFGATGQGVYYGREVLVERLKAGGYIVSIVRKQQGDECPCAASFFQTQTRTHTQEMVGLHTSMNLIKIIPPRHHFSVFY